MKEITIIINTENEKANQLLIEIEAFLRELSKQNKKKVDAYVNIKSI